MNICILGWYGTETMGDRAILDGAIKIFSSVYGKCNIAIGSLYPFFTEHTLLKDNDIYLNNCMNDIALSLFDERNISALSNNVNKADLVIMGGGPIMDINELHIIDKAFKIARKKNIKTCLLGCGMGPLNNERLIDVTKTILKNTDLGIFRDRKSKLLAEKYCNKKEFYYLPDPAIISVLYYRENNKIDISKNNDVVVNFRKHPKACQNVNENIDDFLCDLIKKASQSFENVELIPMHTFFIGGDDRVLFTEIKNKLNLHNINIDYKPMNLYEIYKKYSEAKACIGMRYHSILMQTILNGNNYIIDYTSPKEGKIIGFIDELNNKEFYKNRYYNYTTGEKMDEEQIIKTLQYNKEKYIYPYSDIILEYSNLLEEKS